MAATYSSPKQSDISATRKREKRFNWFLPVSLTAGVLVWQLVVMLAGLPVFILPSPIDVAQRLMSMLADGRLLLHSAVTLTEVLLGLIAGGGAATLIGYALAKSHTAEKLLSPYLIASQAIPVAAIARFSSSGLVRGPVPKYLSARLLSFSRCSSTQLSA